MENLDGCFYSCLAPRQGIDNFLLKQDFCIKCQDTISEVKKPNLALASAREKGKGKKG